MDVYTLISTRHFDGSQDFQDAKVFSSLELAKQFANKDSNTQIFWREVDENTLWSDYNQLSKFDYIIITSKVIE